MILDKADEMGVEFVNLTTEVQDAEAQKAAVDTAITQGVDAIIVGAADSRGWDDSFNKARDAGIPIITVDTGIEHDWVSTLIQTDNLAAARDAGKWIAEQTGGQGKALVIGGSVGHQTGDANTIRTLSDQVALETRTRMLNPKWYEGMLKHGYEGVRHIEGHVTNTMGWSATTGQVAPWVYQKISDEEGDSSQFEKS
mgnify:CR=1 FL=1